VTDDEPTTEELRLAQSKREEAEREHARREPGDETAKHERRADRAAYLKEKLEERERAEREAAENGS
jgi:hypothetical protein